MLWLFQIAHGAVLIAMTHSKGAYDSWSMPGNASNAYGALQLTHCAAVPRPCKCHRSRAITTPCDRHYRQTHLLGPSPEPDGASSCSRASKSCGRSGARRLAAAELESCGEDAGEGGEDAGEASMAAARAAGPSSMPTLHGRPPTASNDRCTLSRAPHTNKLLDQGAATQ